MTTENLDLTSSNEKNCLSSFLLRFVEDLGKGCPPIDTTLLYYRIQRRRYRIHPWGEYALHNLGAHPYAVAAMLVGISILDSVFGNNFAKRAASIIGSVGLPPGHDKPMPTPKEDEPAPDPA